MIIVVILITAAVLISLALDNQEDTYTGWIEPNRQDPDTGCPDHEEVYYDVYLSNKEKSIQGAIVDYLEEGESHIVECDLPNNEEIKNPLD